MLRAIIIDDEPMGINTLKVLIETHTQGLRVVTTASDPEKGMELIGNYKPEVVFLDISMPKLNGFELLQRLDHRDFKLVFTTAHQEYALRAIKTKPEDYLLKPIDIDELKTCVSNLLENADRPAAHKQHSSAPIELHVKDGIHFIRPEDIIRLEASGSYTVFYLANNTKHVVSRNLKECELLLRPAYFYRCHASHIVNLHKVVKMVSTDGLFARMSDGSMPEISRKNKHAFLERLKGL